MPKILVTTIVIAPGRPSYGVIDAAACHSVVVEFDSEKEALDACASVARRGGHPVHAVYAIPLFEVAVPPRSRTDFV